VKRLTQSLAFLGRHLIKAVIDALAHTAAYLFDRRLARMAATSAAAPETAEQNPAQGEQAKRLPEGDRPQSEQLRRQPIPQKHYYSAADRAENN
jgi:hypothetical protein